MEMKTGCVSNSIVSLYHRKLRRFIFKSLRTRNSGNLRRHTHDFSDHAEILLGG
jgi:hypothetical protein